MIFEGYEIRITVRKNCTKLLMHYRQGDAFFTMSVPPRTRKKDILAFLEANREWLRKNMRNAASIWEPQYAAGEKHYVFGRQVVLGQDGIPVGADFRRWRTDQLVGLLNRLLPVWTQRMNVVVIKVTVKEMRSRWGSCSSNHHISINEKLSRYPEECTEMVLVHELCHFYHQDHSPAFYAEMTKYLPDWKEQDELLKHMNVQPEKGDGI